MLRNLENILGIKYSDLLCELEPQTKNDCPTSHNQLMAELILIFVTNFHWSILNKRGVYRSIFGDNPGNNYEFI